MPRSFEPDQKKLGSDSFFQFYQPIKNLLPEIQTLKSRGDRPLQMTFEDQLKMLIFFHLEEHVSARHMLQVIEQDDFARVNIAPEEGIKKAASRKPSTQGDLNNCKSYLKNLAARHPLYCPIGTLNLVTLLPLMAH